MNILSFSLIHKSVENSLVVFNALIILHTVIDCYMDYYFSRAIEIDFLTFDMNFD